MMRWRRTRATCVRVHVLLRGTAELARCGVFPPLYSDANGNMARLTFFQHARRMRPSFVHPISPLPLGTFPALSHPNSRQQTAVRVLRPGTVMVIITGETVCRWERTLQRSESLFLSRMRDRRPSRARADLR